MYYLQKYLKNKTNIEILYNHVVKEIVGDEFVTQTVLLNAQGKEIALNLNGIFVAIGIKPATSFFQNIIKTDDAGFILTDENLKTSCDNIWSAGDCRRRPLRQLVTAAGEGAIASLSAYKYLRGHYVSA
jgi:thioredoxin reductase (NADPH)